MKLQLATHPNLVQIVHKLSTNITSVTEEKYDSKIIAKCSFRKGGLIARIENADYLDKPDYLSVQRGPSKYLRLNSDFKYLNHSCDPNVNIDVEQMAYIAAKDISPGDELNFFYPSTEWQMIAPFECWCGSQGCLGLISGAKDIEPRLMDQLKEKHFFNAFILELFVNQK